MHDGDEKEQYERIRAICDGLKSYSKKFQRTAEDVMEGYGDSDFRILIAGKILAAYAVRLLKEDGGFVFDELPALENYEKRHPGFNTMESFLGDNLYDYSEWSQRFCEEMYQQAGWSIDRVLMSEVVDVEAVGDWSVGDVLEAYLAERPERDYMREWIEEALVFERGDEYNHCEEIMVMFNPSLPVVKEFFQVHREYRNREPFVELFDELYDMALAPFPYMEGAESVVLNGVPGVLLGFYYYSSTQAQTGAHLLNPLHAAAAVALEKVRCVLAGKYGL